MGYKITAAVVSVNFGQPGCYASRRHFRQKTQGGQIPPPNVIPGTESIGMLPTIPRPK
jgi:hypothetical protein